MGLSDKANQPLGTALVEIDSANKGNPEKNNGQKARMMSGMRATGELHIGHYFGALKNWIELQDKYQCYFGVMDWHGMTTAYKTPSDVSQWSKLLYAEFMAWGIDSNKSTLFIQSHVPEHIELFLMFANITPMGWLERVPSWKDSIEEAQQSDTHNLGRFSYPVLQAADIAIYKGMLVPVGADQVAHLELSREIIRRFNKLYKIKLPEPKPLLTETPLVPGLDGRKMSKSYGNFLGLSEPSEQLRKKIMTMPTDPQRVRREDVGDPQKCPVFVYHKLFSTQDDIKWVTEGCQSAKIGCSDCKTCLFDQIESFVSPARLKKAHYLSEPNLLDRLISEGNEKARVEAQKTLSECRRQMGFTHSREVTKA